jgi:c-di-GMP-binding flagellar brake protein YcgR
MKIDNIKIFSEDSKLIYDCSKRYSFPVKTVRGKKVSKTLLFKGSDLPELSAGDAVDVVINTKSGQSVKYFCEVKVSERGKLSVALNSERARRLYDQRRYYKIKTAINCRVVDVTRGEEVIAYNPNLYGKIEDINIGGIFVSVETDEIYKIDDYISFTVVLNESRLEASARVLRVKVSKDGEVEGYGCAFAALPEYKEEIISSYVNYIQIEERRIEQERLKLEKELEL